MVDIKENNMTYYTIRVKLSERLGRKLIFVYYQQKQITKTYEII